MKRSEKRLIAALCCIVILSSAAFAANGYKKQLEVSYRNIKLVVDGVPVIPKNANGTVVEPFIANGTTYLPVRAVGEALDKPVTWDGESSTVYIGKAPGQESYLLDVCPPYETGGYRNGYDAPVTFNMMGTSYTHGFTMETWSSYAYFNLNGEYSSLEFDFGRVDGGGSSESENSSYNVYLDDQYVQTIEGTPDMLVQHISIPLNNALQMKIIDNEMNGGGRYGFANVVLH